jgi:hypothetical protein
MRYKDDILPNDDSFVPTTGSFTNKELEGWYCWSKCWPNSIQSSNWVKEQFTKLLRENPDYKPERFSQYEIDKIREKIV